MIYVDGIATKAIDDRNKLRLRFREEKEIDAAIRETMESRHYEAPKHVGTRGIPILNPDADDVASEMKKQQYLHKKTKGIRIREEMVIVTKDELESGKELEQVSEIADMFSDYYFFKGFQAAYGVYECADDDEQGYCILYAINPVSFMDGSKYMRNSHEYLDEANLAARTIAAKVTGNDEPESERFDMRTLEYYS